MKIDNQNRPQKRPPDREVKEQKFSSGYDHETLRL